MSARTKAARQAAPVQVRTLYSYLRFSTGEQRDGNSTARQNSPLDKFIVHHPEWQLSPDRFTDEGRSGGGAHLGRKGQLGRFLALVKAGVITAGSGLAIENFDRLSRMRLSRSLDMVKDIMRAGVAIVLVPSSEVFEPSTLDDPMALTRLTWEFERAYREAHRKAEYAKHNWSVKRGLIAKGKIVSAWCPFWLSVWQDGAPVGPGRGKLDLDKPCEYRENEKVDIVRQVFGWADQDNLGAFQIAKRLATAGLKFRRAETLTQATICRLLANPAVMGVYVPRMSRDEKGRRVPAGDPVEGYYPVVIDADQFARVQLRMEKRKKTGRGRKGNMTTNLFQGFLFEHETGSPMYVKTSRPGCESYVSKASLKGLSGRTVEFPLAKLERGILVSCRELHPSLLTPASAAADTLKRCERELETVAAKIVREQARYDDARTVADEESSAANLSRLYGRKRELERERDKAAAEVSTAPGDQLRQLHRLVDLLDKTPESKRAAVRATMRGVLSSLISKIEVYVQKQGLPRREVKRAWVQVRYVSGLTRMLCINPDGKVGTMAAPVDFEAVVQHAKADEGWK